MRELKKTLLILLSFVLAVGLMPFPAFANTGAGSFDSQRLTVAGAQVALTTQASYNNNPASILDGTDQKGAYAVLYDDGEMLMQRGNTPNAAKKASNIGITAVYTDIESDYWPFVEYLHHAFSPKHDVSYLYNDYVGCKAYTRQGEFDRDWSSEKGLIVSVRVVDTIRPQSLNWWFALCYNLVSVDLAKLDTSRIVDADMSREYVFDGCYKLEQVTLGAASQTEAILLPTPEAQYIAGADGKWYNSAGVGYDPESIPSGVAMTYHAYSSRLPVVDKSSELDGSDANGTYAVFYGDGEMLVQKGNLRNSKRFSAGKAVVAYSQVNEADFANGTLPWADRREFVTSITIGAQVKAPASIAGWFSGCCRLRSVDLSGLDLHATTDASEAFAGCWSLEGIDLAPFESAKLTDMNGMFRDCIMLKSINLSSFSSAAPTDMSRMFLGCHALKTVSFGGIDTSRVTTLESLFGMCDSLCSVSFAGLDLSSATTMSYLFDSCVSLRSVSFKGSDLKRLADASWMFFRCSALESIDLPGIGFEAPNATNLEGMFCACSALKSFSFDGMKLAKAVCLNEMFCECPSLKSIDLVNLTAPRIDGVQCMFSRCYSLESVDLRGLKSSVSGNMFGMFYGCKALESVNISSAKLSGVTNLASAFSGCVSLKDFRAEGVNTSSVTTMAAMFSDCRSLVSLDLSDFDTSNVENMAGMFANCTQLESVILAGIDTSDLDEYIYVDEYAELRDDVEIGTQSSQNGGNLATQSSLETQASSHTFKSVFKGCKNLAKVTVGKEFSFKHSTLYLPAQSSKSFKGATGKWYTAKGKSYVPSKIPSKKAATYYAVAPISSAKVSNVKNRTYTGKKLKQNPVVMIGSKKLKKGTDYKVTYSKNKKAGTAVMKITGIGKRMGSKTVKFKIAKLKITDAKLKLSKAKFAFNGKVRKPTVKTVGGKALKAGVDYKVKYSNPKSKKPGTYKVWVIGIGSCSGKSASATYKIVAAG